MPIVLHTHPYHFAKFQKKNGQQNYVKEKTHSIPLLCKSSLNNQEAIKRRKISHIWKHILVLIVIKEIKS